MRKTNKKTLARAASRITRHERIRKKVSGTAIRPRMCVTRTNKSLWVQIIDDTQGKTLVAGSIAKGKTANIKLATELGKTIAQAAAAKGISQCVFDRGGFIYHGRIAALATGAREGGLKF
jgi:large subunit ribosomal protein L18